MQDSNYDLITIGVSQGGLSSLSQIFSKLRKGFSIPIVVIQHVEEFSENYLVTHLNSISKTIVKEAEDKMTICGRVIYIAPPSYHLMVERNREFSLNEDPRVNYARPSIDIFFESAAEVYTKKLVGILLTGANSDGSMGLKKIKDYGGFTIVQSPETCINDQMPKSAIALFSPHLITDLLNIAKFLNKTDKYNWRNVS